MYNTENSYRNDKVCRGCDKPKKTELAVCWGCFKRCQDIEPFKHFGGDIHEWIAYAREERKLPEFNLA